jgi:phosphoadenosine phosphosulfate reductase
MNIYQADLYELNQMSAQDLLRFAYENFGERAAIGTSLQKTGVIMIDLAREIDLAMRVFFIDTLANPQETYDLYERVESHFGLTIERFTPAEDDLKWLYDTFGQNAHYFNRQLCCRTRKTLPLQRALETVDVWITGLRADQSEHRSQGQRAMIVRTEAGRDVLKLAPLFDWTTEQIDTYTADHHLPYNALYDYVSPFGETYKVLGCEACHVPIKDGLDKRMGKFPWEQGTKECGMHNHGGGI